MEKNPVLYNMDYKRFLIKNEKREGRKIMRDKISKIVTCCMTAVLLVALLPVQQVQAASKVEGFDVSSKNGVIDW